MSAEEMLIKDLPIYIFAAVNDDYDTMIDVRLYPCDAAAYETAGDEFAKSLFVKHKVHHYFGVPCVYARNKRIIVERWW